MTIAQSVTQAVTGRELYATRICDVDRDRYASHLGDLTVRGYVTTDEHSDILNRICSARYEHQLRSALSEYDLPLPPPPPDPAVVKYRAALAEWQERRRVMFTRNAVTAVTALWAAVGLPVGDTAAFHGFSANPLEAEVNVMAIVFGVTISVINLVCFLRFLYISDDNEPDKPVESK